MATKRGSFSAKRRFWVGHVEGQAAGGLSIRSYCDRHGLALSTFYLWRRRLKSTGAGGSGGALARVDQTAVGGGMFREARVTSDEDRKGWEGPSESSSSATTGVEIVVSRPLRLRLSAGFDEAVARRALRLAREAGEC